MKKFSTGMLARAGVIAALYVVLTFVVLPVASGTIQFRPSEALTMLPLLLAESIPSLFVGCMLANLISGCTALDIAFGSVVSLIAAFLTFLTGKLIKNKVLKLFIGGLFPVLLNAFLLPVIWYFAYGALEYMYMLQVLFLLVSQSAVVYALGIPLILALEKLGGKFPRLLNDRKK